MYKIYTGIGSRKTPTELEQTILSIAANLDRIGYTLRSGGADGADSFFEKHTSRKEIYLPWKNFNSNDSLLYNISNKSMVMAEKYHPSWDKLSDASRKLMARNCYQVLGENLDKPSQFIVCYTKDGKASGGTGQALRIAEDFNIPIFNLYHGVRPLLNYLKMENVQT